MSNHEALTALRSRQVRLMLQATLFVIVGALLGSSFSIVTGIAFFLFNLGFAIHTFIRALRIRTEIHSVSNNRQFNQTDRTLAALLGLCMFLTGLFAANTAQRIATENLIDSVGRCWSVDDAHSYAVDCTNPSAIYRTTAIVDDKAECPVEFLKRDNGQFICVEPIG